MVASTVVMVGLSSSLFTCELCEIYQKSSDVRPVSELFSHEKSTENVGMNYLGSKVVNTLWILHSRFPKTTILNKLVSITMNIQHCLCHHHRVCILNTTGREERRLSGSSTLLISLRLAMEVSVKDESEI